MLVTEIQKFSTKDGPGIRTVVFLKGCPLHCLWCHNPETWSFRNQVYFAENQCIFCGACAEACPNWLHELTESGHLFRRKDCTGCGKCADACPSSALTPAAKEMNVSEIAEKVLREKPFWGKTGGVTLSGGEPLAHPEAPELLRILKEQGVSCGVETCGYVSGEILRRTVPYTDFIYWDLKEGIPETHRKLTGVDPEKIWDNLRLADSLGAEITVRCIVVKGLNDQPESFAEIGKICKELRRVRTIRLLRYHAMGGAKERNLTGEDTTDKSRIPTDEDLEIAREILWETSGKTVTY